MSISKEEFEAQCERFAADEDNRRKGWVLRRWCTEDCDREKCYVGIGVKDVVLEGQEITVDVEVAWHQVYRVPVLCFVAYDKEGSVVRMSTLLEALSMPPGVSAASPLLGSQPTSVISQGPHPVTSAFTLHVHPCETHSSLAAMGATPTSPSYLISFLSITGPLLNLPPYLCQPTPSRGGGADDAVDDPTIPTME